jgi:hypothetical protein
VSKSPEEYPRRESSAVSRYDILFRDVSPRPSCCASRVVGIESLWDAELRTGTPWEKTAKATLALKAGA